MKITDSVRRAILEGDDSLWSMYVKGGCAHHFHVTYRQAPDGHDSDIMRRLVRDGVSNRGKMTHVEREDGTWAPFLLFIEERFEPNVPVIGGRRAGDKAWEAKVKEVA